MGDVPEMVERVARALCRKSGTDPDMLVCPGRPWLVDNIRGYGPVSPAIPAWRLFVGDAHTAIATMHIPTKRMLEVGWYQAHDENADGVWRDMIDTALGVYPGDPVRGGSDDGQRDEVAD